MSWKKFRVHLAGKTNDAHLPIVAKLKAIGQTEVYTDGESDYLLVFCPIASRIGTDISEALDKIPGRKCLQPVFGQFQLISQRYTGKSDQSVGKFQMQPAAVLSEKALISHLYTTCLAPNGR